MKASKWPAGWPGQLTRLFDAELERHLIDLRHELHRHPELSNAEDRTAGALLEALSRLNPAEVSRVAGTGVVARIEGQAAAGALVAIRGDIDALPIEENTSLPYASVNPGVMHACGHDVHAAWAVGAAHLLSRRPARGGVLIVLQPAEELGTGAAAMLESGALDSVAAIFGAHVDGQHKLGQVVAQEGPLAAATDSFRIELCGTGAHGARPHEGSDPIVAAAALVTALQTIVSRRINPGAAAVVTVGSIKAGTAANIIPDKAVLTGTLRAVDAETRAQLQEELQSLATHAAALHGVEAKVTLLPGTPAVVNGPEGVRWAREAVRQVLGKAALEPLGQVNMGGEDFSYYLERMPGCFMRVGVLEPGGQPIAAHSPSFQVPDEAIFIGAAVLAETARIASAALTR